MTKTKLKANFAQTISSILSAFFLLSSKEGEQFAPTAPMFAQTIVSGLGVDQGGFPALANI